MEIVKYICEFFFGNFWHWLELLVILSIVFHFPMFTINYNKKQ